MSGSRPDGRVQHAGRREPHALPAHIPALDGVRGVALLFMLMLHWEVRSWPYTEGVMLPSWRLLQTGWLSLDCFFVLSGFLITGILWDAKGTERYFTNFYARRTLRIFPLYYLALVVIFVLLPRAGGAAIGAAPVAGVTQGWFWGYGSNFLLGLHGWGASPAMTPHFWSLALEEQFYLVWPFVVYRLGRRSLLWTCGACIAGAIALRLVLRLVFESHLPAVMFMPARLDTLALGSVLAIVVRTPGLASRAWRLAPAVAGAAAIITIGILQWRGWNPYQDTIVSVVAHASAGLFFGAVIVRAALAPPADPVSRLFASAPLTWLGRYSYGMYVWHYVFLVAFAALGLGVKDLVRDIGSLSLGHAAHLGLNFGASALTALASWHLFEKHFVGLKSYFTAAARRTGGVPRRSAGIGVPARGGRASPAVGDAEPVAVASVSR